METEGSSLIDQVRIAKSVLDSHRWELPRCEQRMGSDWTEGVRERVERNLSRMDRFVDRVSEGQTTITSDGLRRILAAYQNWFYRQTYSVALPEGFVVAGRGGING